MSMFQVSCQSLSVDLEKGAPSILKNSKDIRRNYKLYNHCSGNHVQIIGKEINARGLSDNANGKPAIIYITVFSNSNRYQHTIFKKSNVFLYVVIEYLFLNFYRSLVDTTKYSHISTQIHIFFIVFLIMKNRRPLTTIN